MERPLPPEVDHSEWSEQDLERMYAQAMEAVESAQNEVAAELRGAKAWDTDAAEGACDLSQQEPGDGRTAATAAARETVESARADTERRVTPAQIIEATLFVGGKPLTTKNLCALLRDEFDREFVEEAIDGMNARYANEQRPYEIRLGEGGYRLTLRPEFESVRNKVFGLGPKEVKLSQESLEVLALVAYHQPVTRQRVEELGKANAATLLRQLLRRELITLERGDGGKDDVTYSTAPRFLTLFGLANLDELPRAEDLEFK